MKERLRPLLWSVGAIVAAPCLLMAAWWGYHALTYDGLCGPYPTDIPAEPCDYSTYLGHFDQAFWIIGWQPVAWAAAIGMAILVASIWLLSLAMDG